MPHELQLLGERRVRIAESAGRAPGEGEVRVADFGIASAAGLTSVTETGSVLGTMGYLAPEQMNDANFYLQRPDAKELIAGYERLGREIESMYQELMSLDGAAQSNS